MPNVLPEEVMRMIKRAQQTPNTPDDPNAREKAIDAAIAKARRLHPECFVWKDAKA